MLKLVSELSKGSVYSQHIRSAVSLNVNNEQTEREKKKLSGLKWCQRNNTPRSNLTKE